MIPSLEEACGLSFPHLSLPSSFLSCPPLPASTLDLQSFAPVPVPPVHPQRPHCSLFLPPLHSLLPLIPRPHSPWPPQPTYWAACCTLPRMCVCHGSTPSACTQGTSWTTRGCNIWPEGLMSSSRQATTALTCMRMTSITPAPHRPPLSPPRLSLPLLPAPPVPYAFVASLALLMLTSPL